MTEGLRQLVVEGFASLRSVELWPGRMTVLIGPNGSGKSNVLRVFRLLEELRRGALQRFVGSSGGAAALLHYGPKKTKLLKVAVSFGTENRFDGYEAQMEFASGDRLQLVSESLADVRDAENETARLEEPFRTGPWESGLKVARAYLTTAERVDGWLAGMRHFHFHDTSMNAALRTQAKRVDDRELHSDGGNLAALLYRLYSSNAPEEQSALRRIHQLVCRVAPAVRELVPVLDSSDSVRLDWLDDRGERFAVHQLSDGTLRAIALVTALAQPSEWLPKLISIDEPELGLHPAAIQVIADLARSISHRTQVIFATQSMAFLDHFEASEVVVAEREDGATVLRRFDERELASWLEDYSLSEIFEKGVLGGRP